MRHLDETFGREVLISVVFPEEEPTNVVVKNLVGVDLMELDSMWKLWIIPRFFNIDGAETLAESFRQRTSWYELCE